jgi:hypothetical protein
MVDGPAKATQGPGANFVIDRQPEAKDMDTRNMPYAYIECLDGEKSLGTWLVTPWMSIIGLPPQEIVGTKLRAELRFERYYQPFAMTLLDASHEKYRGTDIAKNYRSRVRVVDTATREAREVDIYMNHPLRYAGLTIYQSGMNPDPENPQVLRSVLEAVRNPSWLAPYVGCYVVAIGMYFQFRHHLLKFLQKRLGRKGGAGAVIGRIAEIGVWAFLICKFTLKLFGYSA